MSIGFLFPGQGAQHPGMLHALPHHPAIARTISEISEILRRDVLEFDTADALRCTASVQLAMLTAGVATTRALEQEGVAPLAVAGDSAGSFSAAVAAGALALRDAVLLLQERGEKMSELFPRGYGMAAIVGLSEAQVGNLILQAPKPVYVSGINAPRQIVISGASAGVDAVVESAVRKGARKAERLDVSVPSHSPLLQPVADALERSLGTMQLREPERIYVANVTARALRDAEPIRRDLAQNIANPVHWHDSTMVLTELGCRLFLEMPPGHVLSRLAREAFPEGRALALAETPLEDAVRLARGGL